MKIPQIKFYNGYPVLTAERARYVDRIAAMDYGVDEGFLMENAGRRSAEEIVNYIKTNIGKDLKDVRVSLLCGRGNNGGDGLVCARYLRGYGVLVKVFIVAPSEKGYSKIVVENLERAKNSGIDIYMVNLDNVSDLEGEISGSDIIVDALLGVGAVGKPAGIVKKLIQISNRSKKDIISLDIPSGLNPDTGHHSGVFITAKMTLTFGFPKAGLMAPHAQKNIGILKILDIGYPPNLIERIINETKG